MELTFSYPYNAINFFFVSTLTSDPFTMNVEWRLFPRMQLFTFVSIKCPFWVYHNSTQYQESFSHAKVHFCFYYLFLAPSANFPISLLSLYLVSL